MQYPANIRIVRVMCSGSVSPHHVLKAFQQGVDGVFVGGCHMGECNYLYGNYSTDRRVTVLSQMLDFFGIEKERLRARWVSSAEAPEFVEEINHFADVLRKLGPSSLKSERAKAVA
jgi:F420-non-reducing hydrogenase iron-sulfur subunit